MTRLGLVGLVSSALLAVRSEQADEGLTRLVEVLARALDAGSGSLDRLDLGQGTATGLARWGALAAPDWTWLLASWPEGAARLRRGESFVFAAEALSGQARGVLETQDIGAGMVVPMALADGVWGAMGFWWPAGGEPDLEWARQLQPIAALVAHTLRWLDAEAERRRIETWFRLYSAVSSEAIGVHADGVFCDANEPAVRMLRTTREKLIGQPIFEVCHPDDRQLIATRIAAGVEGSVQMRAVRADGTAFWAEVDGRQAELDGRVVRVITVRDVSERVRAQEMEAAARQAQKLEGIGVLAGGIAHDFNNLLVGVLGSADLILAEAGLSDAARGAAEQIRDAGLRARGLTHQLQVYAGTTETSVEPMHLNPRIRSLLPLLAITGRSGVDLRLELQSGLAAALVDGAQLDQVVMNLVTNAVEATDGEGTVVVRTRAEQGDGRPHLVLEVADDGPGMTEEERARAFEPFYSTKGSGRGLGLAAVYGVVRQHGGVVEMEATPRGGLLVRVRLPQVATVAASAAEPRPRTPEAGARVLVVDDEPLVRQVGVRMLERAGLRVAWVASCGAEAIATFAAHADQIEAVLLDVNMPDVNGYAVLEAIRAAQPLVPVVLSSGDAPFESVRADPNVHWLPKPYLLEQVTAVFARALMGT